MKQVKILLSVCISTIILIGCTKDVSNNINSNPPVKKTRVYNISKLTYYGDKPCQGNPLNCTRLAPIVVVSKPPHLSIINNNQNSSGNNVSQMFSDNDFNVYINYLTQTEIDKILSGNYSYYIGYEDSNVIDLNFYLINNSSDFFVAEIGKE